MENKNSLSFVSVTITFFIFICGAVMAYWIYTLTSLNIPKIEIKDSKNLEVNRSGLSAIEDNSKENLPAPDEGYGRSNPFIIY